MCPIPPQNIAHRHAQVPCPEHEKLDCQKVQIEAGGGLFKIDKMVIFLQKSTFLDFLTTKCGTMKTDQYRNNTPLNLGNCVCIANRYGLTDVKTWLNCKGNLIIWNDQIKLWIIWIIVNANVFLDKSSTWRFLTISLHMWISIYVWNKMHLKS